MTSPAELLAAAHAQNGHQEVATPAPIAETKAKKSIDSDSFPALGSAPVDAKPSIWNKQVSSGGVKSVAMRPKHVQEAFSLDFNSQLNVNKIEFFKILNELKKSTNCNIECTSSQQMKKRTFLITGAPNAVLKARKEILRKLTKPVKIELLIPVNCIPAIIGAGGKNLKAITESNAVKVDIDRKTIVSDPMNDVFGGLVKLTIDGNIDGVEDAKTSIEKIVDENTKNASFKVEIDPKVVPFIEKELRDYDFDLEDIDLYVSEANKTISISGPKDKAYDLSTAVTSFAENLSLKLTTKEEVVPKKFHRFIDSDEIYEQCNVVVEIPSEASSSLKIKFTGLQQKINQAILVAKDSSKKFTIDSLNIGRAHNGNLEHAKNVAIFFRKAGIVDSIATSNGIKIFLPSYEALLSDDIKEVPVDFVFDTANAANAKVARKSVVELVTKYSPEQVKSIDYIDAIFASSAAESVSESSENVKVIACNTLSNETADSNKILLIAEFEEDDFGPTSDEIKAKFDEIETKLSEYKTLSSQIVVKTIEIPVSKQRYVRGPNDSTLQKIESKAESNHKISFEGDNVTVRGLPSDVSAITKEMQKLVIDVEDYETASKFTTTLEYPTKQLSRLIGKNGSNLNELQSQFDVKIDVPRGSGFEEKTTITITGLAKYAEEAKTKINAMGRKWADETTLSLSVPEKYQRKLIGPQGSIVNRLQEKYKVRIHFPSVGEKDDKFTVRGASKDAKKAYDELKELLSYEIENGHKSTMEIPAAAISRVIGKGGQTLNAMSDEFGVDIHIDHNAEEKEASRVLEITGTKASIKEVEKKIRSIIAEVESTISVELQVDPKYYKTILGSGGSNLKEILQKAGADELPSNISRRLLVIPAKDAKDNVIRSTGNKKYVESVISQIKELVAKEESMVSKVLEVPIARHGALIGSGGSVKRDIEEKCGVSLQIPQINSKSDKITIRGLQDGLDKAEAMINEILTQNWEQVVEVPKSLHGALANRSVTFRELRDKFGVKVEHGSANSQAKKLASAFGNPKIPSDALGTDGETTKLTIVPASSVEGTIPWKLIGKQEETEKAKVWLEEKLSKLPKDTVNGFLFVRDTSLFRKIIGSRGATISKIRSSTGATIDIPKAEKEINDVITIVGSQKGVEKAVEMILKIVEEE